MQPSGDTRFVLGGQSFVWNNEKAAKNIKKHNIRFEEAASVFLDLRTIYVDDDEHSTQEERSIAIGFSTKARILIVCHCLRENDETILLQRERLYGLKLKNGRWNNESGI